MTLSGTIRLGTRLAGLALVAWAAAIALPSFAQSAAFATLTDHAMRPANPLQATVRGATPRYAYLFTPPARWYGALRWKYNPAGAPPPFAADKPTVVTLLQRALDKWSAQCNVGGAYDGETRTTQAHILDDFGPDVDGVTIVGWGPLDPSIGGWAYAWYARYGSERQMVDAYITLSTSAIASMADLDRLATHEWGHALGLDHSNLDSALMAGPPSAAYTRFDVPQADDVRACRCLYGVPEGMSAPLVCSLPPLLQFGSVDVGTTSPLQGVTITNTGTAPLALRGSSVDAAAFALVAGCTPQTVLPPGASCTIQMTVTPPAAGPLTARLSVVADDGVYELPLAASGFDGTEPAPVAVPRGEVIEFYHPMLDHYFITWVTAEIAKLDEGIAIAGWHRTGHAFSTYTVAQGGASPVCRYYIPPEFGDSHFFGRDASECSATGQENPGLVLEASAFMYMIPAAAGTCPANSVPVYRVFSDRADANHRYMVDRSERERMVAKGWVAEGDGPDRVVMCAPQ